MNGLNNLLSSNKFIELLKSWPTTFRPSISNFLMFPKLLTIITKKQTIETMIDYRKSIMITMNIYLKTTRKKKIMKGNEINK